MITNKKFLILFRFCCNFLDKNLFSLALTIAKGRFYFNFILKYYLYYFGLKVKNINN